MTRSLLMKVQPGQLPVQPGSEGHGRRGNPPVPKLPDEDSLGVDANLQAATKVNPHLASLRGSSPETEGHWECRAFLTLAKAATGCPPETGTSAAPGSPASEGWHAGKVAGSNVGGPHISRPDLQPGNPTYKARSEVVGDGGEGVGRERTSVDRQDNTTCQEQRLPTSAALVFAGNDRRQSRRG